MGKKMKPNVARLFVKSAAAAVVIADNDSLGSLLAAAKQSQLRLWRGAWRRSLITCVHHPTDALLGVITL